MASASSSTPPFHRLLLTGAAGGLGRVLRPRLRRHCQRLRLSDRADLGSAADGEELQPAALEDRAAMRELLREVDAVVHLGGIAVEAAWEPIQAANITGVYHLYEAARLNGVRRIVFASSNHVVGFYRQHEVIDALAPPRPDTLYGVSKAFGENLSRMYFERYGIETVCLRIGSSTPAPENRRMLATWLSHDDLERLVLAALTAPNAGHSIVYGLSDNRTRWWDNRLAAHIGYRPQDSSEPWRAEIEATQPVPDPDDPTRLYHGGVFVELGPYD
ncbi:NAD(P)-dependent oxidoreductase [Aquincola sp. S2]|uniref:NAD(P)-dependent oxidoreductase n=1 Tax=Pseudaquabacterium terrae TaxID=2732868 RepID=A0ABX2EEC9_9BURK|nr:NAD(P)-dependent oxidoreductase [Aquabacterium terrae]NRF66970.1 NAD(P)-dependent oxidoreductase [Aquabacterium terrae]